MSANTLTKRFLLLIVLLLALSAAPALSEGAPAEGVDYAAAVHLSAAGTALRQTVTVTAYVDGDTTHFAVPESLVPGGVLKARYLAINTPECTGKIEEYGKKAAAFTKEKLSSAVSIVIESDDDHWNLDSTGGRYLVWVWYKPDEASDYRNLNIELLQNGLAVPYSASNNRYGDTCVAAVSQARNSKLNVFSGQPDPDFYYGDAVELTIRELREHPEEYRDKKVAFTGIITVNDGSSVYAEQYDAETGLYYGMPVYYGYSLSGGGLEALTVGNETRIVGSFQYYESGGVSHDEAQGSRQPAEAERGACPCLCADAGGRAERRASLQRPGYLGGAARSVRGGSDCHAKRKRRQGRRADADLPSGGQRNSGAHSPADGRAGRADPAGGSA